MQQVVKSKNFDRFKKNATRTKWIDQVLEASGAANIEEAAGWLVAYVGKRYPESLKWAGNELKQPFFRGQMNECATIALWQASGVPLIAQ